MPLKKRWWLINSWFIRHSLKPQNTDLSMHKGFCTEKFQQERNTLGLAHEKGKSHLSFLVSQDHCIECQEFDERNQEGSWDPCVPYMEFTDSPAGESDSTLKDRDGVTVVVLLPWWFYQDDQQGGLIITQSCLYGHFPLGNCPENTNLLHRKYHLGVHHHPWALAICIF